MSNEALEARIAFLEHQLADQQKKLIRLEDIEAIKRLQKAYNYYVEHMLGQEIIDCFADSPDVLLDWIEGKWQGKDGVRRYFARAARGEQPATFSHQLMPIGGLITVDPDGATAKGRWYAFGGVFMEREGVVRRSFVNGLYEMGYIKENGIWKILSIRWSIPYSVAIADGWSTPSPEKTLAMVKNMTGPKPDIPLDPNDPRYVTGYIYPFHFKHPVTGQATSEGARNTKLLSTK